MNLLVLFNNMPVRMAKPRELSGLAEVLRDPEKIPVPLVYVCMELVNSLRHMR